QRTVVMLANGVVSAVQPGDAPIPLDTGRAGLIAPSIDSFEFIWSAQAASAASIIAVGLDGGEHPVATAIPADARLISMDVSRDGSRVVLTVLETLGPKLYVAGVLRDENNAPPGLSLEYGLDVGLGDDIPVDATWIDDRTVAVLTAG